MPKEKLSEIINYVKKKMLGNQFPTRKEIESKFKIDLRTYFLNIEELYKTLSVNYTPIKNNIVSARIAEALNTTRRFRTKAEGRRVILSWVKSQINHEIKPTHVIIVKKFKINLDSYFPNGINEVYSSIGLKYSNKFARKTLEQKDKIKSQILEFVLANYKKNIILTRTAIQNKFKIRFDYYFSSIRELYKICGLEKEFLIGARTSVRRKFKDEIRNLVLNYIRNQVKIGKYPSYREIKEKFGVNLNFYFLSILDAYKMIGINLIDKRNIFTSFKKQELLREITIYFLKNRGFRIIKKRNTLGEDILISDKEDNLIPVELKAYHKSISLPNRLPYINKPYKNEFDQLRNYMRKHKSTFGILITSTSKIRSKVPKNIKLITGSILLKFLNNNGRVNLIKKLEWIRNTYSNSSKAIEIQKKRNIILDYFENSVKEGKVPTTRELERKFEIDLRTYFPKRINELYEYCGISIPS